MHAGSSGPVGALSALAGTTAPANAIPTSVAATAVLVIAPRIFEAIAQFIRRSFTVTAHSRTSAFGADVNTYDALEV
jgi:hypothetical protein